RRRHTRSKRDWSSDVCSSDLSITVLTFLGGLGAMAVPLVLGGTEFQTISPMILSFSNSLTSRDLAAALAIILGLATMIMLVVLKIGRASCREREEREGGWMRG